MAKRSKKKALKRSGGGLTGFAAVTAREAKRSYRETTPTLLIDKLHYKRYEDIPNEQKWSYGKKLQKIVNKQIADLRRYAEKTGAISPELRYMENSGGNISITSGMSGSDLRREIRRALNFMSHQTATVKGYERSIRNAQVAYHNAFGVWIRPQDISEAFSIYDSLKAEHPSIQVERASQSAVMKQIVDMVLSGRHYEDIRLTMEKTLEKAYEENLEKITGFYGDKAGTDGYIKPW